LSAYEQEREENISPKIRVKYTFAFLAFPHITPTFQIEPWCPAVIEKNEGSNFHYAGSHSAMAGILNQEGPYSKLLYDILEGSLYDAYSK